jgi:hypothetical protein
MIQIEGESFANLILNHALHVENLRNVINTLIQYNTAVEDETHILSDIQNGLMSMMNGQVLGVCEQVRIAKDQGLIFEFVDPPNVTH